MITLSKTRVGNNFTAVKMNNRIITRDEHAKLATKEMKDAFMLLLGIETDLEYKSYKQNFDEIFKVLKEAPNPAKKEAIQDVDAEIKRLQKVKKGLKEQS